jgi:hypothetical protein
VLSFDTARIRTELKIMIVALAISCFCLSGFYWDHFSGTVGLVLFMIGVVGGMCMILLTGVHGDFNAAGGVVYVLINTMVFYGLIRLARWVRNRARTGG